MVSKNESITIGITCYNAEATIARAVESALNQTHKNAEILIVDDCSSDNSVEVIRGMTAKNPVIKYIRHQKNEGFPGALNTIVNNASGDFIAFFDDDDFSEPDRLTIQLQRIIAYEQKYSTTKVFCYSNRAIVKAGNRAPDHIAYAIGREEPEPSGSAVADFILWHTSDRRSVWGLFGSCTLMVRKEYLKTLGPFDTTFRRSAEWDMAIRAAFAGGHFIAVNAPLVTQYKTPTADKAGKTPLRYALMLRKKYKKYLTKKGIYLASLCLARYRFNYNENNHYASIFWMAAACALAPRKIFWEKGVYMLHKCHLKPKTQQ